MIISPPFLPSTYTTPAGSDGTDPLMDVLDRHELAHGIYPIAFDRRWHGGVHLCPDLQNEPVRAIADGEVIAYRVCQHAYDGGEGTPDSNAGFVLLKHTTDTGEGRPITFYSLYMHLLDVSGYLSIGADSERLPEFLRMPPDHPDPKVIPATQTGGGHKVYRKDILGWLGRCHGQQHLHMEVFMTQADFQAYFASTSLGNAHPRTPNGTDYWGHSYYVIPGGSTFRSTPTEGWDSGYFNTSLHDGQLAIGHTLYVEAYFHKGQRYTRSWLNTGDGRLTPLHDKPEKDVSDYEYALYDRATKLYPACPSDGYELLRFGRILSNPATLPERGLGTLPSVAPELAGARRQLQAPNPRATWVAVTFEAGRQGYIDINDSAIQKLSDADFPHFKGWQKLSEGNGPFSDDGLCDIDALKQWVKSAANEQTPEELNQAQEYKKEEALSRYVTRNDDVRRQLRGFVCESVSEWDSSNNENRYKKLKAEGEFFHGKEEGYNKFIKLLASFQFWDKTPFQPGEKLWFFHPLQFIRHFRKCGWLSEKELTQLLPMTTTRQSKGQWMSEPVTLTNQRQKNIQKYQIELNRVLRKFCIAPSAWRMAAFFGNATQETQWFDKLYEGDSTAWYCPWDGRGFLQLTGPDNYIKYWRFRGRTIPDGFKKELNEAAVKAHAAGKNDALQDGKHPDLTGEMKQWRQDVSDDKYDAPHSGGAYWSWSGAARFADQQPVMRLWDRGVYYCESFGQVAATVNFGSPTKDTSKIPKVNGIAARFQAYTNALIVLCEGVGFPNDKKEVKDVPNGFKRR